MAKAKVKPIHLIAMSNYKCVATCDRWVGTNPTDKRIIILRNDSHYSKGTFNPKKVTCKRCLKHSSYKLAMDKVNNPLFYWKENI